MDSERSGNQVKLTAGYRFNGKLVESSKSNVSPRTNGSRAEKQNELRNAVKKSKLKRRTTSIFSLGRIGHDLVDTIVVPEGFEPYEWLCANTVDFVDEVYILYMYCRDDYKQRFSKSGEGFPKDMLYSWEGEVVSGPEYIDLVFKWCLETIEDTSIFVVDEFQPWPEDFKSHISKMHTRILRIFCILFHCEYEHLSRDDGKVVHLKTELKHFIFFACYWELLDFEGPDILPLKKAIDAIRKSYDNELQDWEQKTLKRFRAHAARTRSAFLAKNKDKVVYTPTTTDMDVSSDADSEHDV